MDFAIQPKRNADGCLRPRLMQDGDLVIVYERHDSLDHLYLKAGTKLCNRFGTFHHDDIIGRPFGSRVYSKTGSGGYMILLEPTPELWGPAVHTRTQIVNDLDSNVVTLMLDVHPGCVVVESGTGSGCMTINLARAVSPHGRVHSFEYNGARAEMAREEFKRLRLDHLISVTHQDICGKYFADSSSTSTPGGFPGVEEYSVDGVFLDVPEPWLALDHAFKVLKPGKSICCYSPCIDQVIKTCAKLRELSFHSIRMVEVRQRPLDGRKIELETLDLGLGAEEEIENAKSIHDPTNEHQHWHIRPTTIAPTTAVVASTKTNGKHERAEGNEQSAEETAAAMQDEARLENDEEDNNLSKRTKTEADQSEAPPPQAEEQKRPYKGMPWRNQPRSSVNGTYSMAVARSVPSMKGHTAFLTFAIRPAS